MPYPSSGVSTQVQFSAQAAGSQPHLPGSTPLQLSHSHCPVQQQSTQPDTNVGTDLYLKVLCPANKKAFYNCYSAWSITRNH